MVRDIQPTEIYLTPADPGIYPTEGSRKDDIVAVIEFLGTGSSVAVQRLEPDSVAKLVWTNGVPTLNGPSLHEYEELERRSVEQTIQSTMSSGRRILEGDVWY